MEFTENGQLNYTRASQSADNKPETTVDEGIGSELNFSTDGSSIEGFMLQDKDIDTISNDTGISSLAISDYSASSGYGGYTSGYSIDTHKYGKILIDYGMSLDYSRDDCERVLNRYGLGISKNDMLEHLMRMAKLKKLPSPTSPKPSNDAEPSDSNLRSLVIDGSNVAFAHGNNQVYSCCGIKIAADYFIERGHKNVTVFVPHERFQGPNVVDRQILKDLKKYGVVVKTPSRKCAEKRVKPYDDRFILTLASQEKAVVVSNDGYKDLLKERDGKYYETITQRLLPYTFVGDQFIPAEDPLGRKGLTLDQMLRINPNQSGPDNVCPYGRKCTYGTKCKYSHPERRSLGTSLRSAEKSSSSTVSQKRLQDLEQYKKRVLLTKPSSGRASPTSVRSLPTSLTSNYPSYPSELTDSNQQYMYNQRSVQDFTSLDSGVSMTLSRGLSNDTMYSGHPGNTGPLPLTAHPPTNAMYQNYQQHPRYSVVPAPNAYLSYPPNPDQHLINEDHPSYNHYKHLSQLFHKELVAKAILQHPEAVTVDALVQILLRTAKS